MPGKVRKGKVGVMSYVSQCTGVKGGGIGKKELCGTVISWTGRIGRVMQGRKAGIYDFPRDGKRKFQENAKIKMDVLIPMKRLVHFYQKANKHDILKIW